MAGVSMGTGLTSGIDYSTMITQLMQIEAQPQALLKSKLADTQTKASALRSVNTAFATLGSAAQSLTKAAAWNPAKATSSSSTVTATATSGALSGSLTFTVNQLAREHSVVSDKSFASTTTQFDLGSTLSLKSLDGATTFADITPTDSDGDGTVTLGDVVTAINKSGKGFTAAAVNTGSGFRLQVTSTATGEAKSFKIVSDTQDDSVYDVVTAGQDAKITIGDGTFTAKSATNTFTGVMDGTTFTVSQKDVTSTVKVGTDTGAITSAMQALVDSANKAIQAVKNNTDSSDGSTAALKGNYTLIQLADQIRTKISEAVKVPAAVTADNSEGSTSPAAIGIQLTKDGTITFDSAKFSDALSKTPALAQQIASGLTGVGEDDVANTPDDTIDTDGLAARLSVLAEVASDSVAGAITTLASGQDTLAKDLTDQIAAWDLRLKTRQATMTAQFNALETALASLQSQSGWLTSQINSLPKWSSSSS